jgi:hypothetical protein
MHITDTSQVDYVALPRSARGQLTSWKLLREGEALPGLGYYARLTKFHEGDETFAAPRHRHDFEQIRFGVSGHQVFGPDLESDPGDVIYFPAAAYYGPEIITGAEQLLLQWSRTWVTRAQQKTAMEELRKTGEFGDDGFYRTAGGSGAIREVDGLQAVWEYTYGRPLVLGEPRYPAPIKMNPDSFAWIDGDGLSGKTLGRFTENDVCIRMTRWDRTGAIFRLEPNRTAMAWVISGSVHAAQRHCGPRTAIFSDFGESTELTGDAGTEVVCFGFPVEHCQAPVSPDR